MSSHLGRRRTGSESQAVSHASGLPCVFGHTHDGTFIIVVYELIPAFFPRALLQPLSLLDYLKFTMDKDPTSAAIDGEVIIEKKQTAWISPG